MESPTTTTVSCTTVRPSSVLMERVPLYFRSKKTSKLDRERDSPHLTSSKLTDFICAVSIYFKLTDFICAVSIYSKLTDFICAVSNYLLLYVQIFNLQSLLIIFLAEFLP